MLKYFQIAGLLAVLTCAAPVEGGGRVEVASESDVASTSTVHEPNTSSATSTPDLSVLEAVRDLEPLTAEDIVALGLTFQDLIAIQSDVEWEPIAGFGDFSDIDAPWEMNTVDWAEAMARCFQSLGIAASAGPDGGVRISSSSVDRVVQRAFHNQCEAGLNLPEYRPPTEMELELLYEHVLWIVECYRSEGHGAEDPPSFDVFRENPSWRPPIDDSASYGEYLRLSNVCPQDYGNREHP